MTLQIFAIDRIVRIEVANDIPWRENPDFDTKHYFDDIIGVTKSVGAKPYIVTFWVSQSICKYIETKPLHPSQKLIKENADGSCIYQIKVIINLEMFSVFLSYGNGIKILSPEKAVNYIQGILADSVKAYNEER